MTNPFRLGIIIVNYRTADLVIDCLQSLNLPAVLPDDTQIVVVEGGSGDNSARLIGEAIVSNGWSDRTALLPLERNGGFAFANNRGLEHLRARHGEPEYVLFLNPDTVVRPQAVTELLAYVEQMPRVGIAGSRLEDFDGTPQACAFRFPSAAAELESEARIGVISRLLSPWRVVPDIGEEALRVDWVSGASMMVRSRVLQEVGSFDEEYFLYYEEVDLCRRAAHAGWECHHVPTSRVVHLVGQSTGVTRRDIRLPRRPSYWFRSRNLYFRKHHRASYRLIANISWIMGHLAYRTRHLVLRRRSDLPPHLLTDFLRHSLQR